MGECQLFWTFSLVFIPLFRSILMKSIKWCTQVIVFFYIMNFSHLLIPYSHIQFFRRFCLNWTLTSIKTWFILKYGEKCHIPGHKSGNIFLSIFIIYMNGYYFGPFHGSLLKFFFWFLFNKKYSALNRYF